MEKEKLFKLEEEERMKKIIKGFKINRDDMN